MGASAESKGVPGTPKVCSYAVASLVFGILSYMFCLGPFISVPGIIAGHVARSKIKAHPDRLNGSGIALAGLILSYLNFVVFAIFAIPQVRDAYVTAYKNLLT